MPTQFFSIPDSISLVASTMEPKTIGELLYWSYANLAMAHAAVKKNEKKYGRIHFIIRSRLLKGLREKTMNLGDIADDEKLKLYLPQACSYCGTTQNLSIDHLIPTKKGGANKGENFVWACRICNSKKGAMDIIEWYQKKGQFPPLLLLRRYLKIAIEFCQEKGLMDTVLSEAPELPFSLSSIPTNYPQPGELTLWIIELR